jgi:hypothetical protein
VAPNTVRGQHAAVQSGIVALQVLHPGYHLVQDWTVTRSSLAQLAEALRAQIAFRDQPHRTPYVPPALGDAIIELVLRSDPSTDPVNVATQVRILTRVREDVMLLRASRGNIPAEFRGDLDRLLSLLVEVEKKLRDL